MLKILVTDDEEKIRALIKKYAAFEGHTVFEAATGMEAVERCKNDQFDIIIMDVMMPELDGFSALREIRKNQDTPVLMLSARGEEYDKIHGFELGVDDYVVKPFSPKELMLRLEAIIKRTKKTERISHDIYMKDGLIADFTARKIIIDGENIDMSPKEFDLIFYLIKNKNIALTREKLILEVWGYDFCGDGRTLDTHIKLLRKSLGKYAKLITTLRGVGYRFEG
ncbi:response regulator transcription factor [Serpentinicella alkaliphila]|uniref:Stage 0 sporulation protein A homolog n=1 Tax=Serpentinicella alkaliphila TaxID=1734049 RepID=A0A4R2TD28_9FIRM|nr:response regulator transcription factor [Serpentinicella alkaliphila]QUH25827.1 response regulator transcription factor [Serpentinicella alkaliphila]TCP99846.1 DNA-binding response OmpR family regulator [Serpentinicella alkaliphila]